jgi:prevent-host-death family protein
MEVSVSDAKSQLTELVRRAEAGDDVILTRHGKPAVRLVAIKPTLDRAGDRAGRRALFDSIRASVAGRPNDGPSAARSQDFLYDEHGLPR